MELIDAGLAYFSDAIGGLGGNAIGAMNSGFNSIPNSLQNPNPDQPVDVSKTLSSGETIIK
jgi:hypothetical protein